VDLDQIRMDLQRQPKGAAFIPFIVGSRFDAREFPVKRVEQLPNTLQYGVPMLRSMWAKDQVLTSELRGA